jgi:alkyldihydroxyacetonephosphate synthase
MTENSTGTGVPTPPIAIAGGAAAATTHLDVAQVEVGDALLQTLTTLGEVHVDAETTAEASRDWWPLAMVWATEARIASRAAAVVAPTSAATIGAILAACNEARVPVTAAAGRSGVCGGSVPVHGGVVLDLSRLGGIEEVDDESLTVTALAGTFGDLFEADLRESHNLTVGHWPQSMSLSTVGGWVACRGAGQYSTRYGKIEDMVVGLDVALADGTSITTGGAPRAAAGPDLTQLFVGSEGTLGIIERVRLRAHPVAPAERRAVYGFASFEAGLAACREILRRGATPAVLRLYDDIETKRNFDVEDAHLLVVIDEGEPLLIDAGMAIVAEACRDGSTHEVELAQRWVEHRNNVDALESLISAGFVVDTMEIAAPWGRLDELYGATLEAIGAVAGIRSVSAHQSHAYTDGACLYFTFGGDPAAADREQFYRDVWDAGTRTVLDHGGALSHHHGVGLNRSRFMPDALGAGFATLTAVKQSLDPNGILNPGKLGLPSPFGSSGWSPQP